MKARVIKAQRRLATACLLGVLLAAATATAQMQNLSPRGGSSSTFGGQRNLGGTLSGGNRSFAGGMGGGMGGNAIGQLNAGAGGISGNERYIRGNRRAGDFVGADSRDVQNVLQTMGYDGRATGSSSQIRPSRTRSYQPRATNTGLRGQAPVRTGLKVDFDYPQAPPSEAATVLAKRLQTVPGFKNQSLEVLLQERTAILRGAVATEHDRLLAEQLVRLEPGVSQVRNELQVVPNSAPAAGSPTTAPGPQLTPSP